MARRKRCRAFRDGDFSFSIGAKRGDEVGDLVAAHNELGRVLREQRQDLFQRELLLDTVVQNTPTALILVEPRGHVVYANLAARQLLNGGRPLNGERFEAIVASAPLPLARAIAADVDGLFNVELEHEDETFHVSQRQFKLQGKPHRLIQLKRLTRELARQEVATWKKVIRVISHELNNSLAPIRSLSHSGRELAALGDMQRLRVVFDTIEERTRHLEVGVRGHCAHVARLARGRGLGVRDGDRRRLERLVLDRGPKRWRGRRSLRACRGISHFSKSANFPRLPAGSIARRSSKY